MAIESLSDITKGGTSAFSVGGGGTANVAVGTVEPVVVGEYVWFQTDGNGNIIDILVGKN